MMTYGTPPSTHYRPLAHAVDREGCADRRFVPRNGIAKQGNPVRIDAAQGQRAACQQPRNELALVREIAEYGPVAAASNKFIPVVRIRIEE